MKKILTANLFFSKILYLYVGKEIPHILQMEFFCSIQSLEFLKKIIFFSYFFYLKKLK